MMAGAFERARGRADRQRLFHVVDVERRQAVAEFRGVIEQLTERDAGHVFLLCSS